MSRQPLVVGIGGTSVATSSTETALSIAMRAAATKGATTRMFGNAELIGLPHYAGGILPTKAKELIASVREADAIILASPGYHGSVSGLVKNAIDYLEETAKDSRPYLHGLPVGLIATAYGWQAAGTTLSTLRSIVHALRGWPTPYGASLNVSGGVFKDGECVDPNVMAQLETVGEQVVNFAKLQQTRPVLAAN